MINLNHLTTVFDLVLNEPSLLCSRSGRSHATLPVPARVAAKETILNLTSADIRGHLHTHVDNMDDAFWKMPWYFFFTSASHRYTLLSMELSVPVGIDKNMPHSIPNRDTKTCSHYGSCFPKNIGFLILLIWKVWLQKYDCTTYKGVYKNGLTVLWCGLNFFSSLRGLKQHIISCHFILAWYPRGCRTL